MNNQTIVCCVVALLLGMLLANMLKSVCGCKLTEGQGLPTVSRDTCPAMGAFSGGDCQVCNIKNSMRNPTTGEVLGICAVGSPGSPEAAGTIACTCNNLPFVSRDLPVVSRDDR
jgi:hypothetical protein